MTTNERAICRLFFVDIDGWRAVIIRQFCMELIVVKTRKRKRLSKRDRIKVIERDNRTCQACGKKNRILYQEVLEYCEETNTDVLPKEMMDRVAELDHIVPFSRGGECTLDNFQTMCISCNNSKGTLSMEEFIKRRKDLGLEVFSN